MRRGRGGPVEVGGSPPSFQAPLSLLKGFDMAPIQCPGGAKTGLRPSYGKIDFLNSELGEGVSVMRSIKLSMDPKNIMNPGKILRV